MKGHHGHLTNNFSKPAKVKGSMRPTFAFNTTHDFHRSFQTTDFFHVLLNKQPRISIDRKHFKVPWAAALKPQTATARI